MRPATRGPCAAATPITAPWCGPGSRPCWRQGCVASRPAPTCRKPRGRGWPRRRPGCGGASAPPDRCATRSCGHGHTPVTVTTSSRSVRPARTRTRPTPRSCGARCTWRFLRRLRTSRRPVTDDCHKATGGVGNAAPRYATRLLRGSGLPLRPLRPMVASFYEHLRIRRMRLKTMGLAIAMLMAPAAQADEGMWMPSQLPDIAEQLRKAGFRGKPAELADLTKAPLNAVVKVGGATGAFVSDQGLVLTNHHVAFGVIQYNSNAQRDLIRDGFVAGNRSEELPANPDFRLLVTTGFDKVTDKVLAEARGKTGRAYYDAVDAASKALVAECEREGGVRCSVATMFYGRDFYLVKQLELRDLRLVYAPPRAIGNYGDEVDNFVWPRHAGDFTVLRAYVGPDGKPADYAKGNRPYVPSAHLRLARDGVNEGDYVMLAGYPGITYRHRTAAEFADQVEWRLPAAVATMKALQDVIEDAGKTDAQAKIRYASQLQSLKNNIKRFSGELEG